MKKRRNSLIINLLRRFLAEREGFEPPVPLGTAVFKTAVIDHSTISPDGGDLRCRMSGHCRKTDGKGTVEMAVAQVF